MNKKEIQKIKRIRRLVALVILFIIILFLLWFFLHKKDYSIQYQVNEYTVKEVYQVKENSYALTITKENEEYHTLLTDVNFYAKKLISKIETYQEEGETCLVLTSNKTKIDPLCRKENQQISYHLTSTKMKEHFQIVELPKTEKTYHQIHIANFAHHNFYIWNYRGFYHMNENKEEEINLFDQDIYDAKLITQTPDYLFVPNYNEEYYFSTCYLINQKTGKQETWNLKNPIYFDSVVLGVYDGEIYLIDKHEKVEWKLNLKKKTMEKIGTESKGGKTYNNEFIDVSMTKLMNQDYSFKGLDLIDYEINNGMYQTFKDHRILIRQENPTEIILKKNKEVFYLVDETLYSYTDLYGEIELMSYFEWHFNHQNVIFIF